MPDPSPQLLNYIRSSRGLPTHLVWLALALVSFAAATFLLLQPGLHNDNPLWPIWLLAAPLATFVAVRLLPPRRAPALAPLLWLVLAAFWVVGGLAVYYRLTGIDPHILTRANNRCEGNLKDLNEFLLMYVNTHAGRYPDQLDELLEPNRFGSGAPPELFIAPFSTDTPATGPTTRALAAQVSAGGHCSYIYLGKGLTATCPPTTVLLYELLSNHEKNIKGIHVLYADGHIAFLPARQATNLIIELQSAHNPPRPEKLD